MEKSTEIGSNRTGIDASPLHSQAMLDGSLYSPEPHDGNAALASIAGQYIYEEAKVGSMPPPATLKGSVKSMTNKVMGRNPEVFLNKLGERLAYERGGVRLYECFIRKCSVLTNGATSVIPMAELWEIRNEEEEHFLLLADCIKKLGADPTAQTPDADVSAVAASGIMKVLNDPRTSVSQCLEALLVAELTDNAAWELLITLAEDMKQTEMAASFRTALQQEASHLQRVQNWYNESVSSQVLKSEDRT